MMKTNFVVFTISAYQLMSLPLAMKLQREGFDVYLALIEPEMEEDKFKKPQNDKEKEEYQKKYDFLNKIGEELVKKVWAKEMVYKLLSKKYPNTYIIFDLQYGFQYADKLRKAGYPVLNASEIGWKLEKDRDGTLKLLKNLGIDSPQKIKFGKGQSDKAIEYLKDKDELYVLKSDNLDVITMVAEQSNEELIDKLQSEKQDIDKEPFILQERVEGIESCVETWYWNGKPVFANCDFEVKDKYNMISPPQSGCTYDLVFPIDLDSRIRMETMGKMDSLAGKYIKNGILDLAFIYNRERKKYWALEVCGSRFGYNAIYTLLAGVRSVGEFLSSYMSGKDISPLISGYNASLRIFNDGEKKDLLVNVPPEYENNLWLWDIYKKNDKIYMAGNESVGMISCNGENPESAFAKCGEVFDKFFMSSKFVRDDFSNTLSMALPISRYHAFKNLKMYEKIRVQNNSKES